MKINTGAAVLGMVASTQAFHVPMVARTRSSRPALSMSAISDAEVRAQQGYGRVAADLAVAFTL